jgi:uncharacterized protein (DUF4415 family)
MRKSGRIVRYTQKEIEERIARGEDRTDWARVDAMSETELEAAVASDPDADTGPIDPSRAYVEIPGPKEELHLQLDAGVLDWFKSQGHNYRGRINAVLRAYVEHQRERSRST